MSDLLPSDVNKPGDLIVVVNVPYSGGRCALAHLVSPNPPWVWRVYRAGGGWGEGELPVAALTAALAGGTHLARTYATAEDADADRQAMLAGREHPQRNITDSERGKHSPHGLDIKFPEEPS